MADDSLGMTYEIRRQARGAEPPPQQHHWKRRLIITACVVFSIGAVVAGVLTWRAIAYVRSVRASVWAEFIDIAPEVSGRLAELYVRPQQKVRKGEPLARLDDTQLRAALRAAEANLSVRQAEYEQAKTNLELSTSAVESALRAAQADVEAARANLQSAQANLALRREELARQVQQAEAQLKRAQAYLEQLENGPRPEDIQAAEARLASAQALLRLYELEVHQSEQLVGEGIDSQYILEVKKTNLETQRNAVRQAELELAKLKAGARPEEIEAQRQQVAALQAALQQARARQKHELEQLQAEVRRRQAELQAAQAALQHAQARQAELELARLRLASAEAALKQATAEVESRRTALEHALLVAPVDGTIVRTFDDVGEYCSQGVPTIRMTDDSKGRWITAFITEKDRKHVEPGQPAIVKIGLRGGEKYRAVVHTVDPHTYLVSGSRNPSSIDLTQFGMPGHFRVKLLLEDPDLLPMPGMSATVWIKVVGGQGLPPRAAQRRASQGAAGAQSQEGSS